jgi:hypothetical protein
MEEKLKTSAMNIKTFTSIYKEKSLKFFPSSLHHVKDVKKNVNVTM